MLHHSRCSARIASAALLFCLGLPCALLAQTITPGRPSILDAPDISTPARPKVGRTKMYPKNGGWCSLSPAGAEYCSNAVPASLFTDDGTKVSLSGRSLAVQDLTASGTLAVQGTLLAEGSVPINVKAYGAKGDGITDDRLAIQAALNAASTQGGGIVYFPAPGVYSICSQSATPGYPLNLPDKVSLDGPGTIKMCNSFAFRVLIRGSQSTNTSFRNLTFDGNSANNPVNSDPTGTNERDFLLVDNGSNVTVQGMNFINGNDVNTLSLNLCDNCSIIGNHWSNMGINGTFNHDSSEIYLTGKNGLVTNNTFQAAGIGVRTAIEVHMDGKTVTGNVVNGYNVCIIASSQKIPFASDLTITGNTCSNVRSGIQLWAIDGAWDGATIANNQISINRLAGFWPTSNDTIGIGPFVANTYNLSNINVTGNTVKFIADTLNTGSQAGGIAFTRNGGALDNLAIKNNVISGSYCAGVIIQGSQTVTGLDVSGNTIINPGTTANATTNCWTGYRSGIALFSSSLWTGSTVNHNTIIDTQAVPTMQYGTYFNGVSGDNAATGLVLDGNVVRYKGTPAQLLPYHFFAGTTPLFHLIIPNFNRTFSLATGAIDGKFPLIGSTVYDPSSGRTYTQTISNNSWFSSNETLLAVPGSGTGYLTGDYVRNGQSNGASLGWLWNGTYWSYISNSFTPSLSGVHGTSPYAQVSDNTGTLNHAAIFDAAGNVTNGPAGIGKVCAGTPTALTVVNGIITAITCP